jgi:iron complex transport system permease protein
MRGALLIVLLVAGAVAGLLWGQVALAPGALW